MVQTPPLPPPPLPPARVPQPFTSPPRRRPAAGGGAGDVAGVHSISRTDGVASSTSGGDGGDDNDMRAVLSPLSLFQVTFRSLILWYHIREKRTSSTKHGALGAPVPAVGGDKTAGASPASVGAGASSASQSFTAGGSLDIGSELGADGSGAGAGSSGGGNRESALGGLEAMDDGEQTTAAGRGENFQENGPGNGSDWEQQEVDLSPMGLEAAMGTPEFELVETELAALTAGGVTTAVGGGGRGEGSMTGNEESQGLGLSPVAAAAAAAAGWTGGANAAMAAFLNESNTNGVMAAFLNESNIMAAAAGITGAEVLGAPAGPGEAESRAAGATNAAGAADAPGAQGVLGSGRASGERMGRRLFGLAAWRERGRKRDGGSGGGASGPVGQHDVLPMFGGGVFELRRESPGRSFHTIMHRFFAAMVSVRGYVLLFLFCT